MMSPKRLAQAGLGAAGVVLVASVAVLMAGSADGSARRAAVAATPTHVPHPLAVVPVDASRPSR